MNKNMKASPFTRREFIRTTGMGGMAALAAGAISADQTPAASRIDCQSHIYPPEMLELMEKRQDSPRVYRKGDDRYVVIADWHRRILPKHTDVAAKLADMDASGIRLTAISINDPGPELFGKDGPAVARIANDYLADLAKHHPTRFFGLMVLPLQDIKASLVEMERCLKNGMKGILLYSNINGKFPDLPEFRPMFARAEELDVPVLLHPAYPV